MLKVWKKKRQMFLDKGSSVWYNVNTRIGNYAFSSIVLFGDVEKANVHKSLVLRSKLLWRSPRIPHRRQRRVQFIIDTPIPDGISKNYLFIIL